ncbi:MAG: nucleotidyltransferase [Clostridia bacterium]|nr:nucleotidyltransferase [Clostridia bacterium]
MSKVLGIVAEYNPFHNGHLYHLLKSKQIASADFCVAVIGGNFTQRGEPSMVDKWSKAEAALLNGVDLVLELPTLYATSSAENFADGAIRLLDSLRIVDVLSFGAETADINILNDFAEVLYKEPRQYKTLLSAELKKGISYPKARENALMMYLNDIRKYLNVLSSPNNILGIEYLKALKKNKSRMQPISIERTSSGHNDIDFSDNIASATAIRNLVNEDETFNVENLMPASSYSILKQCINHGHALNSLSSYEKEIIYSIRMMDAKELCEFQDVSEGLENLIKKAADSCNNISDLIKIVSSKRYTETRIQRILLYILLDVTKKDMVLSKKITPYARILGFNEKGKQLISQIVDANPRIEFVSSVKKFLKECPDKNLLRMLEKDILATNIYTLGYTGESRSNLDYTKKIISI